MKSLKGKLIADFRHKNAKVQVRYKTLSWPEAVRKGKVYGGKNFKSKTSPKVDLDHHCCFEQRVLEAKERSLQYQQCYFERRGVGGGGGGGGNLKSAIQEVINSVNKLSCLPKQEDKECSLCVKFDTVVEVQ